MIIECVHCHARYKLKSLPENRETHRVRCTRCSRVFSVSQSGAPVSDDTPASPPKVIAVSNQKGGVAKTSTALNLGYSLSLMRKSVLLIDFDPQANLTLLLGGGEHTFSFYDAVSKPNTSLNAMIRATRFDGVRLLPGHRNLALLNRTHGSSDSDAHIFDNLLEPLRTSYDHVIIDTPPSLDFLTLNAMAASELVIVPCQADFLATQGVGRVEQSVTVMQKAVGRRPDMRVLITMFDPESTTSRMIRSKLMERFGAACLRTVIDRDEKLRESQVMGLPAHAYDSFCSSALQYLLLAKELSEIGAVRKKDSKS